MKRRTHSIRGVEILFEDDAVIVVDKAPGILTEATRRGEGFTVQSALDLHVRKGQARSSKRVWPVNRLDRETSGVLLFAKSPEIREAIQAVWHSEVEKTYLAIAWGKPPAPNGSFHGYLYEDRDLFVRQLPATDTPANRARIVQLGAKYAETDYEVLAEKADMTLLRVRLRTGRRNQIRVQFADAGCPLVGDAKYGPHAKPFRELLCLHALELSFPHPVTGKRLGFQAALPTVFTRLFPAAFPAHERHDENGHD